MKVWAVSPTRPIASTGNRFRAETQSPARCQARDEWRRLPSRQRPKQAPAVVVDEDGAIVTIDDLEDRIDDLAAPGGSIRDGIDFDGGEPVFIERPLQFSGAASKRDALAVQEKIDLEALSRPVAQGRRFACN